MRLAIYLSDGWGYFVEKGFRWYYMGNVEVPDIIERELDSIVNILNIDGIDDKDPIKWVMDQDDETTKMLLNWIKSLERKKGLNES